VLGFVAVVVIVIAVLQLPGEEDPEEMGGLVAGNWGRLRNWFRR
jgi:hypothetical protein